MPAPLTRLAIVTAKMFAKHAIPNDDEIDHEHIKLQVQNRKGFQMPLTPREELWDIAFSVPGDVEPESCQELCRGIYNAMGCWNVIEAGRAIHHYGMWLEEQTH